LVLGCPVSPDDPAAPTGDNFPHPVERADGADVVFHVRAPIKG
jgi:hypothetical protein